MPQDVTLKMTWEEFQVLRIIGQFHQDQDDFGDAVNWPYSQWHLASLMKKVTREAGSDDPLKHWPLTKGPQGR